MFAPILLLLALLLPSPLLADQSVADIEALLSEVPEGDKPELKKLRDDYNQALQLVREGERYQQQAKGLKKFMDEYPVELKKLEQQQARLKPTDTSHIPLLDEKAVQQELVDAKSITAVQGV